MRGCDRSQAARAGCQTHACARRSLKCRGSSSASPDGPARALRCALAIVRSANQLHIPAAAAVEVGVISSTATLSSVAVQGAIQLAHAGSPGETLASESVCEISAASGLSFVAHTGRRPTTDQGFRVYEVRSPSD